MSHQIAVLLPHLGGKAYSLRSAIVHAIGSLLHKAFDRQAGGGGRVAAGEQGVGSMVACCRSPYGRQPAPGFRRSLCCSSAVTDAADAQGAQARLRTKQHLLDLLCERIRWVGAGGPATDGLGRELGSWWVHAPVQQPAGSSAAAQLAGGAAGHPPAGLPG